MNKLQQAAEQYAIVGSNRSSIRYRSFLAGAAYAAGEFAEWCSEHGWAKAIGIDSWSIAFDLKAIGPKTTAELYELWQQSL